MDRLRDQLLAGARLARDQHRRVGRRRLLDHPVDASDARAVPDDASVAALFAELAPQDADLAERFLPLDRLVEQNAEPLRVDRLGELMVVPFFLGSVGALSGALCRQENNIQVRELVFERAQQAQAVEPRHDQIRHDDRRTERRNPLKRFLAVGRVFRLKSPRTDQLGEPRARRRPRPRR